MLSRLCIQVARSLVSGESANFSVESLGQDESSLRREGLWIPALQMFLEQHGFIPDLWKEEFLQVCAWQMQTESILRDLAEKSASLGSPVITFKGCSLSLGVYSQPLHRSFGDVDMTVSPAIRQSLLGSLAASGYSVSSDGQMIAIRNLCIDFHSHPLSSLSRYLPCSQDVWHEGEVLHERAGQCRRLPWEKEFLVGLFHGAKHAYSRANWLVDLLVLGQKVEPGEVEMLIRRYNGHRHLWLAQSCAEAWFGLSFPAHLQRLARAPGDPFSSYLLRRILKRIAPDFLGMLTPLWCIRGARARLLYLQEALFPHEQSLKLRLRRLVVMFRELLWPVGERGLQE